MSPLSPTQEALGEILDQLLVDFRNLLEADEGSSLSPHLARRCQQALSAASEHLEAGFDNPDLRRRVAQVAFLIRTVSSGHAALGLRCQDIQTDLVRESRRVLQAQQVEVHPSCPIVQVGAGATRADRDDAFAAYRTWFLSHFDSPYPLGDDRDHLLIAVPSHDRLQLENWFANARRRSGWTAFRREFAHDSPALFQRLLDSIDEPGNEAARDRYEKVRLYFEPDRQGEVSETIRTLVRQGPPSETPGRAGRRLAKRATRGVSAQQAVEAPLTPESNRSPRRRERNAPSDSFQPDIEVDLYPNPPPAELADEARYPSSFASPTSSLRSVSNSSSSSLDSLISYGSSDYAPRIDRMEQPAQAVTPVSWAGSAAPVTSGAPSSTPPPRFALPVPLVRSTAAGAPAAPAPRRAGHPFFCTIDELPSASSWAMPAGAAPSRA